MKVLVQAAVKASVRAETGAKGVIDQGKFREGLRNGFLIMLIVKL